MKDIVVTRGAKIQTDRRKEWERDCLVDFEKIEIVQIETVWRNRNNFTVH